MDQDPDHKHRDQDRPVPAGAGAAIGAQGPVAVVLVRDLSSSLNSTLFNGLSFPNETLRDVYSCARETLHHIKRSPLLGTWLYHALSLPIMKRILSEVVRRKDDVVQRNGRAGALQSRNERLGIEWLFAAHGAECGGRTGRLRDR